MGQLHKCVQYLISSYHSKVSFTSYQKRETSYNSPYTYFLHISLNHLCLGASTAQRVADKILKNSPAIKQIQKTPEPTAGQARYRRIPVIWMKPRFMTRLRHIWNKTSTTRRQNISYHLFSPSCPPPGARLLIWKSQKTPMTDKCRQLWNQLGPSWSVWCSTQPWVMQRGGCGDTSYRDGQSRMSVI